MQAKQIMEETGKRWVVFVEVSYREEACCRPLGKDRRPHAENRSRNAYITDHCAEKYYNYFNELKTAIDKHCSETIVAATSYMPDFVRLGQVWYVPHSYQYPKEVVNHRIDDEYKQLRLGSARAKDLKTSSNASWEKAPLSREGAFEVHLFLDTSLFSSWQFGPAKHLVGAHEYMLLHSKLWSRHWPNVQNIVAKLKAMQPEPPPPPDPSVELHIMKALNGGYCAGGYPWKFARTRLPENRLHDRCESVFQKFAGCDRCGQEFQAGYRCEGGTHGVCSKCIYKNGCMFMA